MTASSTPSLASSAQPFALATGGGSLEAARGTMHVGDTGDQLTGEYTAFGEPFNAATHATKQATDTTWTNQIWNGAT